VPRLGLTPVAEALVQLVGADETAAAGVPGAALAWVAQTSVLPQLLALCAAPVPPAGLPYPTLPYRADVCTAAAPGAVRGPRPACERLVPRVGRAGRQGLLATLLQHCGACTAYLGVAWLGGLVALVPALRRKELQSFLPRHAHAACASPHAHSGYGRGQARTVVCQTAGRRVAGCLPPRPDAGRAGDRAGLTARSRPARCTRPLTPGMRGRRRLNSVEPPGQLHENAAEVLGAVARARACPLTRGLAAPGALAALAAQAFPPEPRPRRVQARPRPPAGPPALGPPTLSSRTVATGGRGRPAWRRPRTTGRARSVARAAAAPHAACLALTGSRVTSSNASFPQSSGLRNCMVPAPACVPAAARRAYLGIFPWLAAKRELSLLVLHLCERVVYPRQR